ncbi:calcium-binding protein [Pseudoprimorskyibacter insulae]|uniref:Leukotoxin n=1 Tax=Pseudoprimorskyibacter insulae TaxID=1695997 RepID=A0A2R8AUG3_9RHOB|nr:calcium-binding protein [Pseudoprimorskyibacter insulae]SPF79683.1 Leukotoxin [Pseudoprimorskyibacter insulae]
MTTYTLNGFVLSYDSNDTLIGVAPTQAHIVAMNEHNSHLSYTVGMAPSGELPFVYLGLGEIASMTIDDYGTLQTYPGTFADYRLGQISGGGFSGVILSVDNVNVMKSYVFSLGGDQIGPFNSVADVQAFNKSISSAGTAQGSFAPSTPISLQDLTNPIITENDTFWALQEKTYATGQGNDHVTYNDGLVTVNGGAGFDTVMLYDSYELSGYTLSLTEGELTLSRGRWDALTITNVEAIELNYQNFAGDPSVLTYSYDDLRIKASAAPVQRNGTDAADSLTGLDGDDTLNGNGGNDTLDGADGKDTLNGGDGDDMIYGGTSAYDLRDLVYAGAGNDYVDGGYGNDLIYGMDGNDTLLGGFGVDELIGQGGDDELSGGAWSDLIFGGAGNDFINGGFGYDRVNGGDGADRFYHLGVEGHGSDWLQDYSAADGDVLVFGQSGATKANFQVNLANTTGAGQADLQEAFVIYKPTGQIIWALVDGAAETSLMVQVTGAEAFDLLA